MAAAAVLRTARLLLRPYEPGDVDALHRLWTDPGVRRYLWDDRVIPRETAAEVVAASLADWQTHGYGQWVITMTTAVETMGFVGLRTAGADRAEPELLFGLAPHWWGKGLADEAARAALGHAFEALGLPAVWASTDRPNFASRRLLERLGMVPRGTEFAGGRELLVYGLTPRQFADSYLVRRALPLRGYLSLAR